MKSYDPRKASLTIGGHRIIPLEEVEIQIDPPKRKIHVHHDRCPPAWMRTPVFTDAFFFSTNEVISWLRNIGLQSGRRNFDEPR